MGMLAKIRRMHFRDAMSLREVARRTGLSRNTVRNWLRQSDLTEPTYPVRAVRSVVDPYKERKKLERLCRYISRPAVSEKHLLVSS